MANKPAPKPPKPVTVRRDAGSGQFVTKPYADRHPKTTETERYRRSR